MPCVNCEHGSATPHGGIRAAKIQTPDSTEVRSWTELPLFQEADLPEDLDFIGGSNSEYQAWRIPAAYVLPGGSLNRTQYKVTGNESFEVPTRQVVPVFTTYSDASGTMKLEKALATSGETATDLVVDKDDNGVLTIMNNGYYTFPRPHGYEVGKTYYLSQAEEGEVISVRPTAGLIQPLFTVVDLNTISINVNLY